jgi:hypothetical protein
MEESMTRLLVLPALLAAVFLASAANAGQEHHRVSHQKGEICRSKIEPKGLKGPAFKSEMQKCKVNPDLYT